MHRTVSFDERVSTLEIHTYAFAVRTALRKGRVFLPGDKLVGLRLPPGAAIDAYKDAVEFILKPAGLERYLIPKVTFTPTTGETDDTDAVYYARYKAAVVVLIQHEAELANELVVGLDRIIDVGKVNARHLVEASKSAVAADMPLEVARKLVAFPPKLLFLALRPGRSYEAVLEKLLSTIPDAAPDVVVRKWEPRVEDLDGFGKAKDWALDLVADLNEWRAGKIAWADISSGILLIGEPGTGKTMFGEAVARSCDAHFIAASTAIWQSAGHLGDMLKAMRASFEAAAKAAPTVLLIDETDAIGDRSKFSGHNADYNLQVVNALLELLDGAKGREGVIVIGTTNNPANVDPALLRPGRLDWQVVVELPDREAREGILITHLGEDAIDPEEIRKIAVATSGCSGAQLRQFVSTARRKARRHKRGLVANDLTELVPRPRDLTQTEHRIACLHEAGHAIVGLELGVATLESMVVLRQVAYRDGVQGYVQWRMAPAVFRNKQSYMDEIAMVLGGVAAERVILGELYDGSGSGLGSDLHRATDLATLMVTAFGMSDPISFVNARSPEQLAALRRNDAELRGRIEALIAEALRLASEIIGRRRGDVERLVASFADREILSGDQVAEIITPQVPTKPRLRVAAVVRRQQ